MRRVNAILNNETFLKYMKQIAAFEKERIFCRHDIEHCLSVARLMLIQSYEEQLGIDKEVIYAAALLHDIGRALQYESGIPHEKAGGILAGQILKQCNYTEEETERILGSILTHNRSEKLDSLGECLRRADQLSRNCFACPASKECNWTEEKKNKGVIL